MLTPTSLRMAPALARHVDAALPEPLNNDRNACSGLIAKYHGDRILPKFMQMEHVIVTGITRLLADSDAAGGIFYDGGAKLSREPYSRG